jgi:hypothetical protein
VILQQAKMFDLPPPEEFIVESPSIASCNIPKGATVTDYMLCITKYIASACGFAIFLLIVCLYYKKAIIRILLHLNNGRRDDKEAALEQLSNEASIQGSLRERSTDEAIELPSLDSGQPRQVKSTRFALGGDALSK